MSKSIRRLGRGLDSLVSNLRADPAPTQPEPKGPIDIPQQATEQVDGLTLQLPIDALSANPFQPRSNTSPNTITTLADSIRTSGVLQPILVRRQAGRFQIIAGERRWRAAREAGLTEVPVVVRDASDEQMIEWALIENIQREDLNAIDRAMAYRRYCLEFRLKPEEVAQRLSEDRTTVVNYLRLLDLPAAIRAMVGDGALSMGHARCLLGVADAERQAKLAESVAAHALSVRALEDIVRREKTKAEGVPAAGPPAVRAAPHIRDLERRMEQAVKTKVTIRESRRKGRGRIIIEYYSLDDFDRIAALLGVEVE